jgi:hypothetical protein
MKFKRSLYLIFSLFLILSCSGTKKTTNNNPSLTLFERQAHELQKNWDAIVDAVDLSYENILSWVPESGIRGRYAQFKTKLGRQMLEKIVGHKAFIKGPHADTLNLKSLTEFGHYNPKFLKKLNTQLKTLYTKKTFVEKFQDFYDRELQDYLRVHYQAHNFIKYNPEYKTDYLNHIEHYKKNPELGEQGLSPTYEMYDSFYHFGTNMKDDGYDVYEAHSCPSFWMRRSIDGTSELFFELLETTLKTFDSDFALLN